MTFGIDCRPSHRVRDSKAVTEPGGQFKFEIIVRTEDGNNTAIESCFVVRP